MPASERFKIAFIGTHGIGKTTLCYGLAARLKANDVVLEVVHEVARRCPLPINRETNLDAQSWILHTQIADEIVAQSRAPVVVCDRSVLDNYAYLLVARGGTPELSTLVDAWTRTYALLVHVPIVNRPTADGVRNVDPEFQSAIQRRIERELEERNLAPLRLDPAQREGWLEEVERAVDERLGPRQLPLIR